MLHKESSISQEISLDNGSYLETEYEKNESIRLSKLINRRTVSSACCEDLK